MKIKIIIVIRYFYRQTTTHPVSVKKKGQKDDEMR